MNQAEIRQQHAVKVVLAHCQRALQGSQPDKEIDVPIPRGGEVAAAWRSFTILEMDDLRKGFPEMLVRFCFIEKRSTLKFLPRQSGQAT